MGEAITRHSLRPLYLRGTTIDASLGRETCRGNAVAYPLGCLTIKSEIQIRRRPGQASERERDPGSITTGFGFAKNVDQIASQAKSRGMGPGLRRDDSSGLSRPTPLAPRPHRCYITPARLRRASGANISPGPYRSFRELSLAGSVDPDIWCPPTFVGNSGIACFNGVCGFALFSFVIPRESGVSRTLRLLRVSTKVSGILDHPHLSAVALWARDDSGM